MTITTTKITKLIIFRTILYEKNYAVNIFELRIFEIPSKICGF